MTQAMHPSIRRARQLATWLDSAVTIPVINKKVGLDPVLGLIPGFGDVIATLLACYPLWIAYDLGFPRKVLFKMTINLLIDTTISLIPVYGDLADVFWKSNMRNVEILEQAYHEYGSWEHGRTLRYTGAGGPIVDVTAE